MSDNEKKKMYLSKLILYLLEEYSKKNITYDQVSDISNAIEQELSETDFSDKIKKIINKHLALNNLKAIK